MNRRVRSDLGALGESFTTELRRCLQRVTLRVRNLSRCLDGKRTQAEFCKGLGPKDQTNLAKKYVQPALAEGLIEMTLQDIPRSRQQKYRLIDRGRELQVRLRQAP